MKYLVIIVLFITVISCQDSKNVNTEELVLDESKLDQLRPEISVNTIDKRPEELQIEENRTKSEIVCIP